MRPRSYILNAGTLAVCAASADVTVSALAVEAAGADGKPAEWVKLIPMGAFGGQRDARGPWLLDGPSHAAEVVAASQARSGGQDPVVDYDHASEAALSDARTAAPASGWMKELQARADGIYARIEWTEAAAAKLKAKEYRYISPVFGHEKPHADGRPMRVTRLFRAGLTNNPCLPELAAVAALDPNATPGTDMDLKKIAKALGLAETATEDQVLAACATARAEVGKVAVAAGLKADARADEVVTAVATLKTGAAAADPSKFVPMEQVTTLSTQLKTLQDERAEEKAVAAVDAAVEGGKLAPAVRAWALNYAKTDPPGFATYVAAAPVVIAKGPRAPGERPPNAEATADADELTIAASMGLDKATYLEAKKANAQ